MKQNDSCNKTKELAVYASGTDDAQSRKLKIAGNI